MVSSPTFAHTITAARAVQLNLCFLQYAGRLFLPPETSLEQLKDALRKLKGLGEDTELEVYEEIKVEPTLMIEEFPSNTNLGGNQIEDGDIFIFQQRVPPVRPLSLKTRVESPGSALG